MKDYSNPKSPYGLSALILYRIVLNNDLFIVICFNRFTTVLYSTYNYFD